MNTRDVLKSTGYRPNYILSRHWEDILEIVDHNLDKLTDTDIYPFIDNVWSEMTSCTEDELIECKKFQLVFETGDGIFMTLQDLFEDSKEEREEEELTWNEYITSFLDYNIKIPGIDRCDEEDLKGRFFTDIFNILGLQDCLEVLDY